MRYAPSFSPFRWKWYSPCFSHFSVLKHAPLLSPFAFDGIMFGQQSYLKPDKIILFKSKEDRLWKVALCEKYFSRRDRRNERTTKKPVVRRTKSWDAATVTAFASSFLETAPKCHINYMRWKKTCLFGKVSFLDTVSFPHIFLCEKIFVPRFVFPAKFGDEIYGPRSDVGRAGFDIYEGEIQMKNFTACLRRKWR